MNWLTDNPIPLFVLGLLVQVVLGVLLWQTSRMWIAIVMGACGIASIAALIYEIAHVSPTEQIAARLDEIADLLETNDPNRVIECIAPDATQVRSSALAQLRRIKIEEATMAGNLQIAFEPPADPAKPEAVATFNGRLKAQLVRDPTPYNQFVQRFRVWFRQQDGKWMVTQYELNPR
jgi:hypothetical protein